MACLMTTRAPSKKIRGASIAAVVMGSLLSLSGLSTVAQSAWQIRELAHHPAFEPLGTPAGEMDRAMVRMMDLVVSQLPVQLTMGALQACASIALVVGGAMVLAGHDGRRVLLGGAVASTAVALASLLVDVRVLIESHSIMSAMGPPGGLGVLTLVFTSIGVAFGLAWLGVKLGCFAFVASRARTRSSRAGGLRPTPARALSHRGALDPAVRLGGGAHARTEA